MTVAATTKFSGATATILGMCTDEDTTGPLCSETLIHSPAIVHIVAALLPELQSLLFKGGLCRMLILGYMKGDTRVTRSLEKFI